MVDNASPPAEQAVREIQNRLAGSMDRWVTFPGMRGRMSVLLPELAVVVSEICDELVDRRVTQVVVTKYLELADSVSHSTRNQTPEVVAALMRWHGAILRRAAVLSASTDEPTVTYPVELISFGALAREVPMADRFEWVHELPDIASSDLKLLTMPWTDKRIRTAVLALPGVAELVEELVRFAERTPDNQRRRIAIGSVRGQHRAPVIAHTVAELLREAGVPVTVAHRDTDHSDTADTGPTDVESADVDGER